MRKLWPQFVGIAAILLGIGALVWPRGPSTPAPFPVLPNRTGSPAITDAAPAQPLMAGSEAVAQHSLWVGFDHSVPLARYVSTLLEQPLSTDDFGTGSELFDQEWLFGAYMMAALGFGQLALLQPEDADTWREAMEVALDGVLSEDARAFDISQWGEDPLALESLSGDHAAYLGYANLALSLYARVAGPEGRRHLLEVGRAISTWLAARLVDNGANLLATYPDQSFPVDNCAIVASLGLLADDTVWSDTQATRWLARLDASWRDPLTGLLYQLYDPDGDRYLGAPRGSGTALCAYFLSFSYPDATAQLLEAINEHLVGHALGLTAVREYPDGWEIREDIDSGPIVMGFGVSATGFTIGAAQALGDDLARPLIELSMDVGMFHDLGQGEARYQVGTPVHNAIMLAMLTAHGAAR